MMRYTLILALLAACHAPPPHDPTIALARAADESTAALVDREAARCQRGPSGLAATLPEFHDCFREFADWAEDVQELLAAVLGEETLTREAIDRAMAYWPVGY